MKTNIYDQQFLARSELAQFYVALINEQPEDALRYASRAMQALKAKGIQLSVLEPSDRELLRGMRMLNDIKKNYRKYNILPEHVSSSLDSGFRAEYKLQRANRLITLGPSYYAEARKVLEDAKFDAAFTIINYPIKVRYKKIDRRLKSRKTFKM